MIPGHTQFTLTLSSATSKASAWVSAMTAPLAAEYGTIRAEPVFPDLEEKLMIFPSRRFLIPASTPWMQ